MIAFTQVRLSVFSPTGTHFESSSAISDQNKHVYDDELGNATGSKSLKEAALNSTTSSFELNNLKGS